MLSYVNIHGRPVSVAPPIEVKKKARAQPDAYHKGWRVMGIPPGSMERPSRSTSRRRATRKSAANRLRISIKARGSQRRRKSRCAPSPTKS